MSEPTVFEARLRAALRRHVAAGPTEFDAAGFARAVAAAEPRRRGLVRGLLGRRRASEGVPWERSGVPSLAWLLVALLLAVALISGALLAGALRGPGRWQAIDLPGADRVSAAFATDQGCFALGLSPSLNEPPWYEPLLWASADCLHWAAAESAPSSDGDVAAITAGDDGLVGVGAADGLMAAWRSTDGRTWRRTTTVTEGAGRLLDVAFAHGRYVAVGMGPSSAAIKWSADGERWVDASDFPLSAPGFVMFPYPAAVVSGGPGFVAVGGDSWTGVGGVWTSTDGDTWRLVDLGSANLPHFDSVAIGPRGRVVALAGNTVFVSPDAMGSGPWASSELSVPGAVLAPLGPGAEVHVASVAATDWGYVAVGSLDRTGYGYADPLGQGLVWSSLDGRQWTLTEPGSSFTGVALERVMRCGDALVVAGSDGGRSLRVWTIAQGARSARAVP